MKKIDKKDILCCSLLASAFIIFVLIITQGQHYYGSYLDWESQHIVFPDYFRTLFYSSHDLIPDFAFNLGSGQNIFNFSYYGLLSPIILISYLLPWVRMSDYIVISTIVSVISSAILFYFWLRRNNEGKHLLSFLASFAFLFAVSLSFHSHRHIMFINYMPFLVMGLFGVDKKLVEKKGWLLTLSTFLMIMTSYYYSIGGIITLVLYGIYKYIRITKKIKFKLFFIDGFKFLLPIIIGVFCSSIIIFPTFYVILTGRGETFNTITLKDLLIPSVNVKYVCYESYGIGLTSILILSIVNLFFKKRENLYLGIVLSLIIIFPFINYILNATMYIDAKALIPLLPLTVYSIYLFLKDNFEYNINIKKLYLVMIIVSIFIIFKGDIAKAFFADLAFLSIFVYLSYRFKSNILLVVPCIFIPFVVSLSASYKDSLVNYESTINTYDKFSNVINQITETDSDVYRINNLKFSSKNLNNTYGNVDFYSSTVYSSTYNMNYNKFYYDVINNPVQIRNRVNTTASPNIMFLMFSGNKYMFGNRNMYHGYESFDDVGGYKIYKNDNVLPIAYARSDILSETEFDKLGYPWQSEALLKNVIVGDESNSSFDSHIKKAELDLKKLVLNNVDIDKNGNNYTINAKINATGEYSLPSELVNKVIFIRFKMLESAACSKGDTYIEINNIRNKLTCREWKYHNQNYTFDYVLGIKDLKKLDINFSKGTYNVADIEMYYLDYDYIKNVGNEVDEFQFDKTQTVGDKIVGDISVSKDGYFVTSIPYDKGFEIDVDGQRVDYENVNKGFVGFKIDKGNHHIDIEYKAPYKKLAMLISAFGFIIFISFTIFENIKFRNIK